MDGGLNYFFNIDLGSLKATGRPHNHSIFNISNCGAKTEDVVFDSAGVSTSTAQRSSAVREKASGVVIRMNYSNLTDYWAKGTSKSSYSYGSTYESRENTSSEQGTSAAGIYGLDLGYQRLRARTVGFDAGISYLRLMNRDDNSDNGSVQIYKGYGNINYSVLGTNLFIFGGLNLSQLTNPNENFYYEPWFGGQLGLGTQIKGFTANLGYSVLGYKYSNKTESAQIIDGKEFRSNYDFKGEGSMGGFTAQIGYQF